MSLDSTISQVTKLYHHQMDCGYMAMVGITKKCLTSINNHKRKDSSSDDDSDNDTGPSNECQENIAWNMMQLEELGHTMGKMKLNQLKPMTKKAAWADRRTKKSTKTAGGAVRHSCRSRKNGGVSRKSNDCYNGEDINSDSYCPPDELEEGRKEGSEKIKKCSRKLLQQKYTMILPRLAFFCPN